MKKSLAFIFFAFFLSWTSTAQIKALTENGDSILVFDNGTWKEIKPNEATTEIKNTVHAEIEIDEFSGDKKIKTESWFKFGKSSMYYISGYIYKAPTPIFYIRYSGDLGCLSKYRSTMMVKLTSGDVIQFTQITDTECGDNELAGFIPVNKDNLTKLTKAEINSTIKQNVSILKSYDWETIRIQGSKYYSDLKPNTTRKIENPEQFFRQHITAIESK